MLSSSLLVLSSYSFQSYFPTTTYAFAVSSPPPASPDNLQNQISVVVVMEIIVPSAYIEGVDVGQQIPQPRNALPSCALNIKGRRRKPEIPCFWQTLVVSFASVLPSSCPVAEALQ
jgi:hypothetical protein